jgi:hypothetical protein
MPIPSYVDPSRNILVGPQIVGDGGVIMQRGGNMGETIVAEMYGKYGELVRRGLVFAARVNTAAAVPINTTLTNAPALWNPSGSGKTVVPLKILFSVGAIGTPILNGFTLSYLANAGATAATAAPVLTFTTQASVNMLIGKGPAATTLFAPAVATYTTQPAVLVDLGLGHHLEGAAASAQLYTLMYDFDSSLMLPQGTLIAVGSTIATSTTYYTTIIYAEFPVAY